VRPSVTRELIARIFVPGGRRLAIASIPGQGDRSVLIGDAGWVCSHRSFSEIVDRAMSQTSPSQHQIGEASDSRAGCLESFSQLTRTMRPGVCPELATCPSCRRAPPRPWTIRSNFAVCHSDPHHRWAGPSRNQGGTRRSRSRVSFCAPPSLISSRNFESLPVPQVALRTLKTQR
jgi:hypothetical protein